MGVFVESRDSVAPISNRTHREVLRPQMATPAKRIGVNRSECIAAFGSGPFQEEPLTVVRGFMTYTVPARRACGRDQARSNVRNAARPPAVSPKFPP